MSYIISSVKDINSYLKKYEDPRISDWALMSSPFYTLGICLGYLFIVKFLGPRLMKNRKPFELKWAMVVFSFEQMMFNAWLCYEVSGWLTGEYSLRCEPVNPNTDPKTMRIVSAAWWYYITKFTDLIDTLFFILRKKDKQVTTLHLIHHSIMPMSIWIGVKFVPGGHTVLYGGVNCFVHVFMYLYYMLSALGLKKYVWWKKYLTILQLIQFVFLLWHVVQVSFIDCRFPLAFDWFYALHALLFFVLFSQFYKESYTKKASDNGIRNGKSSYKIEYHKFTQNQSKLKIG